MRCVGHKKKGHIFPSLIFFLIFSAILILLALLGERLSSHFSHDASERVGATERSDSVVVVIDAGHGGEDGGAIGVNGIYEKDINLDIALTLRDILSANGIDTVLTRSEDILLYDKSSDYEGHKKEQDLNARKEIASSYENAIFVSIHMNSFPVEKYSGLQVYYSVNHEGSHILSKKIQELTKNTLMTENERKVKEADSNIFLLHELSCPAVLVECGFLSNTAECERLSDPEYRTKLALCLSTAICEYIDEVKK